MYEQIAREQAARRAPDRRLRAPASRSSASPFNFLINGGVRRLRDRRRVIAIGVVGRARTTTATRSRSRSVAREAGRRAARTPATTTSSRGCASRAGCPKPRLYIIDDPAPNAFATGATRKHAAIAVTTGLLEKMNRVELEGVLAHELSHVKNYDMLVMTLAVTMVGIIALLSDFFLRFMFWGGGRRRSDERNNPLGAIFAIFGVRPADLRADHRLGHAVRGQPAARVPRPTRPACAHALSARPDLRAGEAQGRQDRRSTPRRRRLRTSGSRSPSTRRAKKSARA